MSAAFRARYPGTCGECGERFDIGDEIRYSEQSETNFVHDMCPVSSAPKKEHPVCPVCRLIHPEGECDRG